MSAFDSIALAAVPGRRTTLFRAKGGASLPPALSRSWKALKHWAYGTKLYEFRLKGRHPVQLLSSPDDPHPGNGTRGSALIAGDMIVGPYNLKTGDGFWRDVAAAPAPLARHAGCFRFLGDLAALSSQKSARETAERLTRAWLEEDCAWNPMKWSPDDIAERIVNWIVHAPLVLSSLDLVYRSRLLHCMARQIRHLANTHRDTVPGLGPVRSAAALTLAGLALPSSRAWCVRGEKALNRAIARFILADGGPASRNPGDLVPLIRLLVILRSAYLDREDVPPETIQHTLDRVGPFVRGLRLSDGSFAHVNGAANDDVPGLDALLAASNASGKALENASHSGYQRLSAGRGTVVCDAGPPPAPKLSACAHAGTAAFEMSSGRQRLIVNMGHADTPPPLAGLDDLTRTSAAHSTLILDNRNSSRLLPNGQIGKGVTSVQIERHSSERGDRITLVHDGYAARFGVKHQRTLSLSPDGLVLEGQDKLVGKPSRFLNGCNACLRFHLHPDIQAAIAPDGRVVLETPSGEGWLFSANNGDIALDDSLYLPRRDEIVACQQIVVIVTPSSLKEDGCVWRLARDPLA